MVEPAQTPSRQGACAGGTLRQGHLLGVDRRDGHDGSRDRCRVCRASDPVDTADLMAFMPRTSTIRLAVHTGTFAKLRQEILRPPHACQTPRPSPRAVVPRDNGLRPGPYGRDIREPLPSTPGGGRPDNHGNLDTSNCSDQHHERQGYRNATRATYAGPQALVACKEWHQKDIGHSQARSRVRSREGGRVDGTPQDKIGQGQASRPVQEVGSVAIRVPPNTPRSRGSRDV